MTTSTTGYIISNGFGRYWDPQAAAFVSEEAGSFKSYASRGHAERAARRLIKAGRPAYVQYYVPSKRLAGNAQWLLNGLSK